MAAHFNKALLSFRSRAKADLLRTTQVPSFFEEPTALVESVPNETGPVKASPELTHAGASPNEWQLRTLIVTADAHFRRSLRQFCARLPEVEIVAEAENRPDALRLLEESKPTLAFVDLYMPGLDTQHAAPFIEEFARVTHVILFTSDDAYEVLSTRLVDDAAGFVSRRCYGQDLPREIKRALAFGGTGIL
jgi:CheY-like chemotaxis protein